MGGTGQDVIQGSKSKSKSKSKKKQKGDQTIQGQSPQKAETIQEGECVFCHD